MGNANYTTYSNGRKIQRWALATLFNSLNGNEWTVNDGWTEDAGDLGDECTWYGIVCDDIGSVMAVELNGNNLRGEVPVELALLSNIGMLAGVFIFCDVYLARFMHY